MMATWVNGGGCGFMINFEMLRFLLRQILNATRKQDVQQVQSNYTSKIFVLAQACGTKWLLIRDAGRLGRMRKSIHIVEALGSEERN